MGNYNSQYESYYSSLINKRKKNDYYNFSSNVNSPFKFDKEHILKRFVRELIGVLLLFLFVLGCKVIVTPQTKAAYEYSKKMLDENYDYGKAVTAIKSVNLKDLEDSTTSWLENIKTKLTGEETIKEKITSNFMLPAEGDIVSAFGQEITMLNGDKKVHEGIDIDLKTDSEVICPYKGRVKKIGEDKILGKYILIDHGDGVETKYGGLNSILVSNDESLSKGSVIGKSGGNNELETAHLHFELIYMGENKDPKEYMNYYEV